ncbi:type II toxin-antitoxin system HicB family antitoxin [Geminocystis sp. CENA526]|uniref:type II toxin-antitoxin system HicB family antitoxin n=1 Tax=Geminocystis sp. CENA526 TaxID=1355871 RepID=UPI003D6F8260
MKYKYTAKYTKIPSGYMGQIIECQEVITEGKNLAECRLMLEDALKEMILAYQQLEKPIPLNENNIIESLSIEVA